MEDNYYKAKINEELKRFNSLYNYKFIIEQEAVEDNQELPPLPDQGGENTQIPPAPNETLPPMPTDSGSELPPVPDDTNTPALVPPSEQPESDESATEEIDVTELVNITRSLKKDIEATKDKDNSSTQKMDSLFSKLGDLENKLSSMDSLITKIDSLSQKVENMKPPTPVEKLEMRSLDSYPFNQKPNDFFNEKQQQMRMSGKNEYVLTKDEVENYGKDEIRKSFFPVDDFDNIF